MGQAEVELREQVAVSIGVVVVGGGVGVSGMEVVRQLQALDSLC